MKNVRAGETGHIIAKMNSLCDQDIIAALYEASAAGVKIELIVRGICSLKVGIPGVSENISVRSIAVSYTHLDVYKRQVLYRADKKSRPCFACPAEGACSWPPSKKNLLLKW